MSDRWKMERMGFVNFWLYDEEIFSFADGKLLLRGQNGSGKSITTQSFIPFILDGDRTPSRLDPFGSSDRKMEYYFLGEEGKEESTGYLFLEFHKEASGQYRTIGIGQRAQRGKPMGFWGFVLTDGRRIGYDLQLYQEVGGTRIPCTKQELKKLLGDQTPFTDVPGEYKGLVNKHIFGFERMEQYEQFIRLLVKVRAPKLSKEFKPTKVYDILNESLQTLTDEDLRAMVDAMEKMDGIQSSLEHLREAFKDTQVLRVEYTRYNQFMLAKKAQAYLDERAQVKHWQDRLENEQTRQQQMEEEASDCEAGKEKLEQESRLCETEIEGLGDTDLNSVSDKLEGNREKLLQANSQAEVWSGKIAAGREQIRQYDAEKLDLEKSIDFSRHELEKDRIELDELQETLQFEQHGNLRQWIKRERCEDPFLIQQSLKELKNKIIAGQQALKEQEIIEQQYDMAASELADRQAQADEINKDWARAEQEEDQARDTLIEQHYLLARQSREWKPNKEELSALEQAVTDYNDIKMAASVRSITAGVLRRLDRPLAAEREQAALAVKNQQNELEKLRQKLEQLRLKKELEPARPELVEAARKALGEAEIPFVPFYQAIEFAPQLDLGACALLETQLSDAGLLDALVVAKKDQKRVLTEFAHLADVLICVEGRGGEAYDKLTVNEELEADLKAETRRILCSISEVGRNREENQRFGEDAAPNGGPSFAEAGLVLSKSGYYRSGVLMGHSIAAEDAGYVGRLARKRKREQLILALEAQLAELDRELLRLIGSQEDAALRITVLEKEYEAVPDMGILDEAIAKVKQLNWKKEQADAILKQAEQMEQELLSRKKASYQTVLNLCKALPYGRRAADYQEAKEQTDAYQEIWDKVRDGLQRLEALQSKKGTCQERIELTEDAIDTADQQLRREKNQIEELKLAVQKAEEYLNQPENRKKADRLCQLKEKQKKALTKIQVSGERIAVLNSEINHLREGRQLVVETLTELIGRESGLRECFEEELDLGLIIDREAKALSDCAGEAVLCLRESDKGKSPTDLTTSLYRVYQQHSGSLANYGTALEDCFEELEGAPEVLKKRQRIVSVWNGKKLYLEQFYTTLRAQIEETELLIQQKDRELFENILSRTLSQQLTGRIKESRDWIRSMSRLMQQMDTSMGLSFSLDWKPRAAETDQELDTQELEKLLLRNKDLLTMEDIERLAAHFRSKIKAEKQKADEDGGAVNYLDLVRDALDYRRWFEFQMSYYRNQDGKKPLTNAAFNKFSGGEKAMAMYVPLFAAVNAQYQKAANQDHPRIIALDEAFAGVDDKNISTMFEVVGQLDFDYVMNSQALWGCYASVPALRISELLRPANAPVVTVIHYTWNGHERILDEQ